MAIKRLIHLIAALAGVAAIVLAIWQLKSAEEGVVVSSASVDGIPVTVFRPEQNASMPAVLIAHGFAGSQQLMQSFALNLARNGYVAVTFDFAGHGRNPRPMTGDLEAIEGATQRLLQDTDKVAYYASDLGDGRLAVLGHSMASDIVVRHVARNPAVMATILVSSFSPAITSAIPRNLLVIAGDWEGMLKEEALRVVGLAAAPGTVKPGVTYGDFTAGTARRAVFSPHVEHVGVLFSTTSLRESLSWLDQSFGIERQDQPVTGQRGISILLLFGGIVLLSWPLSLLLPRVCDPPVGASLDWRRMWPGILLPMIATPLILRMLPTHFLPVLVADYLTAHFLLYGGLTAAWVVLQRTRSKLSELRQSSVTRSFLLPLLPIFAFGAVGLVLPLDYFVTSFIPVGSRPMLIAIMLVGTLLYFCADEWLTRGDGAARGAYAVSKLAFLASLAIAVALDLERLFFLIIVVPVIAVLFILFGLWSRWLDAATGHPLVAGFASAVFFAWAIGVTFPLIAG